MTAPTWSILIASAAARGPRLARLLAVLGPQCEAAAGRAEVVAYRNPGGLDMDGLAKIRQALLDEAAGEFVSYADDDDQVSEDYVPAVLAALDASPDADYVAFRHSYRGPGMPAAAPVHTGLRYGGWYSTLGGPVRDITHVNPVRASIARAAGFGPGPGPEDRRYVAALRAALAGHAEVPIGRALYHYHHDPSDSVQYGTIPVIAGGPLPPPPGPWFRWHPDST